MSKTVFITGITGQDGSYHLAKIIADVIGFKGDITYYPSKPDGTPRKLMDCSRINNAGWKPQIPLRLGIEKTYQWYLDNCEHPTTNTNQAA